MDRIYLDNSATTPLAPEVCQVMMNNLKSMFGNPSSLHWAGQEARASIEGARKTIAQEIGALPEEIIFTSGATEANNLALMGTFLSSTAKKKHILVSPVEHHSVLHVIRELEKKGVEVTYLPVDGNGIVDPKDVELSIRPFTFLISLMMVNNEIGSIQRIAEIGELAKKQNILMHSDAVQAIGLHKINVNDLNLNLLSISAHKIYGPKGIGALYVKKGTRIQPILYGGPQEMDLRAGTENVPGILGFEKAVDLLAEVRAYDHLHIQSLKNKVMMEIRRSIKNSHFNCSSEFAAPHILSISFPDVDGEALLVHLNKLGVAVSMGSACNSKSIEPSHVLKAIGVSKELMSGTIRVSFGRFSTEKEIDYFLQVLPEAVRSSYVREKEAMEMI
jgi:cysteine desulfurase